MWSALVAAVVLVAGIAAYVQSAPPVRGAIDAVRLVAGGVLLYGGIVAVFVAAYFALAWIWRADRPADARIGWRRTVQLVIGEYGAILLAPWRMVFYRQLVPDALPQPATERPLPVLLVHGVLCNAGVWSWMARRLREAGIGPVHALSYGPPLASIYRFAGQMHAEVERICALHGVPQVVVVAHSMGGLVALAYVRRFGTHRVRRLVTIGTPWQGSHHANWFPGMALRQLRPGNAWLRALDPRAPGDGPAVVSVWSWHDSMVTPQTSSILPGATNVALVGIAHNALLASPQVLARVIREYREARTEPARVTATPDTCSAPGTLP
jgi:triacylglycerol esterase/lipase EstA (alpha/beta hydrolase family)